MPISVHVDKITNSIIEVGTNFIFDTAVVKLNKSELLTIHKKHGWQFNWKIEGKEDGHRLYKLVINGSERIQGLLSLEIKENYIEMHLIENAPHNLGRSKKYAGCAGNMVAFACKMSFDLGFSGFVAFEPKTKLVDHYEKTLGAEKIFKGRMQIATDSAKKLVNSYYKDYPI